MPIGKVYEGHSFQSETKPSAKKYLNDEAIYEYSEIIEKTVTDSLNNEIRVSEVSEIIEFKNDLRRERPRVQPFETVEDIFNESILRMPRSGSVIDEEIRLAREKESDLRKSKGVDEVDEVSENRKSIVYVLEVPDEEEEYSLRRDKVPAYKDMKIKRLSENRLKTEFLGNKKREQDLLSEGKIKSLSQVIDIDFREEHTYTSQYSKDELNGVSLDFLKSLFKENSGKESEVSMKEDEELKDYKIQLARSHFIESEDIIKKQKSRQESEKIENKSGKNETSIIDSFSKTETKVGSTEPTGKSYFVNLEKCMQKEELEKKSFEKKTMEYINSLTSIKVTHIPTETKLDSNGHLGKNTSEIKHSNVIKTINDEVYNNVLRIKYDDDDEIKTNQMASNPATNSKTDDYITISNKKYTRRSLGPGGFARFISNGDTEKRIAKEIETGKQREQELKNHRRSLQITGQSENRNIR